MPKEKTYDLAGLYDAVVSWRPAEVVKPGYVQVGLECTADRTLPDMLAMEPEPDEPEWTGIWGTFDEEGLDRIIKALQKAKRQAFGT